MCRGARGGPSAIECVSRCFVAGCCGAGMLRIANYSKSVTKRTSMWITSHFAGVNDMNTHLMIARALPIYALEVHP